jgi:hypothetical protein
MAQGSANSRPSGFTAYRREDLVNFAVFRNLLGSCEVTIHVRGGGSYCVYRPKLVINVNEEGKILLGDPMGTQLRLDLGAFNDAIDARKMPPPIKIVLLTSSSCSIP